MKTAKVESFNDHNDVKIHVQRARTDKIFRLCEEFDLLPVKTLNLALSVGLSRIDQDLRFKHGKRYLKKLTAQEGGAG